MNTYAQYNAARFNRPTDSTHAPRRESRDAYQMHVHRFTNEQRETAARVAGALSLA